jgi:4-amino-4-deoxy-L-arabinose transferase-like glycosyltransferase
MDIINFRPHRKWLVLVLIVAAFIRLATLGAYPLTDNTEARYAEVAREMLISGNWITPQLDGVKFWAKPPLSIWITAGTMSFFGINEFAARLSPLLLSLFVVWLTYFLAVKQRGHDYALAASVVLVSSVLFFISSGAVMTDSALTLGTTLSMVAFWHAVNGSGTQATIWGYLFFLGLAIGLLAKGPIGVVLTFIPIGIWVLCKSGWRVLWSRIPWIKGLLFTAALTLPWYLAAEARTPGFLNYFFIGEHWKRFTQTSWSGDLNGFVHNQPRGMIWLFWLMAAFPWSFVFLVFWIWTFIKRHQFLSFFHKADEWTIYLLLWAISPMLFFTLSGNILWTYVLPGLPAFSLLLGQGCFPISPPYTGEDPDDHRWAVARPIAGLLTPVVFGLFILVWSMIPAKYSQKYLIYRYLVSRPNTESQLIYLYDRPYSAEFYSSGNALKATDLAQIDAFFSNNVQDFIAVKREDLVGLLENFHKKFNKKLVNLGTYDNFILLCEPEETMLSSRVSM